MKFNALGSGAELVGVSSDSVLMITSGATGGHLTCSEVLVDGVTSIVLGLSFSNCPLSSAVRTCRLNPSFSEEVLG